MAEDDRRFIGDYFKYKTVQRDLGIVRGLWVVTNRSSIFRSPSAKL
jgi:hypothetical protein